MHRAVPLAKSPPNFRPQAEVGAESDGRPLHTQPCTPLTILTFALTVDIRMGHRGRGTNVAKPNARGDACESHARRVRHTSAHNSIAHEEVVTAILADVTLVVEIRIWAPRRSRACQYIGAADGLTNR